MVTYNEQVAMRMTLFPLLILSLLTSCMALYQCVCSFNSAKEVFKAASNTSRIIAVLPKGQCLEEKHRMNDQWTAVNLYNQIGFIYINGELGLTHICVGDPPDRHVTTTQSTTKRPTVIYSATPPSRTVASIQMSQSAKKQTSQTTTSTVITQTSQKTHLPGGVLNVQTSATQSTKTPQTSSVAKSSITAQPPTMPGIIQGHPELCPMKLQRHTTYEHGFLGQYGNYCYEYVPMASWHGAAQRDCEIVLSGNLTDITSKEEQLYLQRWLASHNQTEKAWIGLSKDFHGNLRWQSGAPVQYTNVVAGSLKHGYGSCFTFNADGHWERTDCGHTMPFGMGFGEEHPYICKYQISEHPLSFFAAAMKLMMGR